MLNKFIKFKTLPPVLQIHLMRFTSTKTSTVKLNKYFQIFSKLDLDELLEFDEDANVGDNKYHLHWVIMHRGVALAGHYFSYIKHDCNRNIWHEYNDECVSERSEEFVLEYASVNPIINAFINNNSDIMQVGYWDKMSAYMLVYVKDSECNRIITPFNKENLPNDFLKRK